MMPLSLKKLSSTELERKIYIYMINEAFNELPEWLQKSEQLLTEIEKLPRKMRKKALLKVASIIMSDDILHITEEEIKFGKWRGKKT